jgi:hypothetical protein
VHFGFLINHAHSAAAEGGVSMGKSVALWSLFDYTDKEPFCERNLSMTPDPTMIAGLEISSGRKPVTFARLDEHLKIQMLEKWDSSETLSYLHEYEFSLLAINVPSSKRGQERYSDLTEKLVQAGFEPFSPKRPSKQWLATNAQDCFRILSGHSLLSRRSLEGRLQRSAILYEQGLQIRDPVDMFEEITRFKLIQGILPLERLHASNELDALAVAYLAWMSLNRPGQIVPTGEFVLPAGE